MVLRISVNFVWCLFFGYIVFCESQPRIEGGKASSNKNTVSIAIRYYDEDLNIRVHSHCTAFVTWACIGDNKLGLITACHCFAGQDAILPLLGVIAGARSNNLEVCLDTGNCLPCTIYYGACCTAYNNKTMEGDLAYLKCSLEKPLENFNMIEPIKMCTTAQINASTNGTLFGYGATKFNGTSSDVLQEIPVSKLNLKCNGVCERFSKHYDDHACLEGDDMHYKMLSQGPHNGDSGGPLITNNCVAGIVSHLKSHTPTFPMGCFGRVVQLVNSVKCKSLTDMITRESVCK